MLLVFLKVLSINLRVFMARVKLIRIIQPSAAMARSVAPKISPASMSEVPFGDVESWV